MKPPIKATEVPPRSTPSAYPPPFAARMEGRQKRQLGDQFGLHNFGVNLTTLEPRSEEHTSELQTLMRISYAVSCLTKQKKVTRREKGKRTDTHKKDRNKQTTLILQL